MATNGGPNIIEDGLVFAVDAANKKSYPGSGTTWTDLAGSNNGTLTNGPTFDSGNGGSIDFDGTNDYITTLLPLSTFNNVAVTIDCFFKWNGGTKKPLISGYDGGGSNRWDLQIKRGTDNVIGIINHNYNNYITSASISPNQWYQVCVMHDQPGNVSKIYINGVEMDSTTSNILSLYSNAPYLEIGDGDGGYFDGSISQIKIYTRNLSSPEILQNYNALKGRFGL